MKQRLQKAILNNEPLDWLLYETIKNATVTIGPITLNIWPELQKNLQDYHMVWRQLTTPEGRQYIKNNLDKLLDYVEQLLPKEQPQ